MPPPPSNPATAPSAASLRLRRHADFQAVYAAARKHYAKEMSFFFVKRIPGAQLSPHVPPPPAGARIGLTVGKVLGKAHDRNRIKRRLREAVRRHALLLDGLPVDVVLHPRRTCLTLEWTTLEAEVSHAFRTVQKLAHKPQAPPPPRDRTRPRKPVPQTSSPSAKPSGKPAR